MAKKWTKSWMHEQNCCFANLNLLLFQPFSFLSPSLSPLLLICSHFILFAFSLFHSPLLSISTSCCERCFCMPCIGLMAQLHKLPAMHGSTTWSIACVQMPPTLKKIWRKRIDVCVAQTLIVFHKCLYPRLFFRAGGVCTQATWSRAWFMFSDENPWKS